MLDRDYDAESERQKSVEEFYRLQHINQTYDFVSKNNSNKLENLHMDLIGWHIYVMDIAIIGEENERGVWEIK